MFHCFSTGICQNKREEMFMLGQEVRSKVEGERLQYLRIQGRKANVTDRKSIIATGNQICSAFDFYRWVIYES